MGSLKSIKDLDLKGKKVLVRVDFNVPFDEHGSISDDTRIVGALPTIQYLCEQGARVVLVSHLGRPKGERIEKYSLKPVAAALADKLGQAVAFVDDCIGAPAGAGINALEDGQVLLLENARYHAGETTNDPAFAKALAEHVDAYVNDAFGTAHRAHASTYGVAELLSERAAGFLIEKELEYLGSKTANPERPFTVILGGAKVSDKIQVIEALLEKADTILIGGAMAYTFGLATGRKVGCSLTEPDKLELAKSVLEKAKSKGVNFLLPLDTLVTDKLDFANAAVGNVKVVEGDIEDDWEGVDIGPKTIALYAAELAKSKTILWNGPMGVFEIEACSKGTFSMADAVAQSSATSIIGGGDSVKAVKQSGKASEVSFISTGGGASLEFLEGKELPGISILKK